MRNWNQAYKFIDFDFVDLRFAPVLRLPRLHFASLKLRESEEGSEENQFTPLGEGVKKLIFKRFIILYPFDRVIILQELWKKLFH
jgi:hypothetical protein